MILIKNIIEEKIKNEHLFLTANKKEFAYSEHICAYLHALAFLNLADPLIKKKNVLWKRFSSASESGKLLYYQKLLKYKPKENEIILHALNKIDEMKQDQAVYGTLYKPFTWGILSFERSQNL